MCKSSHASGCGSLIIQKKRKEFSGTLVRYETEEEVYIRIVRRCYCKNISYLSFLVCCTQCIQRERERVSNNRTGRRDMLKCLFQTSVYYTTWTITISLVCIRVFVFHFSYFFHSCFFYMLLEVYDFYFFFYWK